MHQLGLTPEEFGHVVHCCRRVLLSESTDPRDLQWFLVSRLGEACPRAAARIGCFDRGQMERLREQILAEAQAGSALWARALRRAAEVGRGSP